MCKSSLLLMLLAAPGHEFFQQGKSAPATPAPAATDPYQGFVGVWRGTNTYFKERAFGKPALVSEPIELVATESARGHSLRLQSTYGIKGQGDYARTAFNLQFEPSKQRVLRTFESSTEEEVYQSPDLNVFVQAGAGTFRMYARWTSDTVMRCTHELTASTWTYLWEQSTDGGKHFTFYSRVALIRVTP